MSMILDLENDSTLKTVILTTNFTESSRNANRYALNLFRDENVQYVLLNSYYEPPLNHDGLVSADELLDRNSMDNLVKEKQLILKEFAGYDLNIECAAVYGVLAAAINEAVETHEADYVVIGNKPDFSLENTLLRYKTANFIRKINCSVLAVPEGMKFSPLHDITFASDMKSIKDIEILRPVVDLVRREKSKLNILYVAKDDELLVGEQAQSGLMLDSYFATIPHEFHHSSNNFIISGITRFTETTDTGLVILLARKHNFFRRLVETSKTEMMSELAKTPLLVLHEY